MEAVRAASLCLLCLMVSSEAQEIITAEVGQEVILRSESPNINITAVEWSRPDQDPDYVLFYRDGRLYPDNQHSSYQNRVDLQDEEMKDGDVSLILKNVTKEDTGRYECRVFEIGNKDPINIFNLEVLPSGKKHESSGDKVGITRGHLVLVGCLILLLLAVFASVGFLTFRNHRSQNPNIPVPPDETAAEQML